MILQQQFQLIVKAWRLEKADTNKKCIQEKGQGRARAHRSHNGAENCYEVSFYIKNPFFTKFLRFFSVCSTVLHTNGKVSRYSFCSIKIEKGLGNNVLKIRTCLKIEVSLQIFFGPIYMYATAATEQHGMLELICNHWHSAVLIT